MTGAKTGSEQPLVLVTGAAGLIGAAVAERLRKGSFNVLATDIRVPEAGSALDFTDRAAVFRLADLKIDTVVHCGAISGPADARDNPHRIAPVNVGGTINLLELASVTGIRRFVYCSSTSVYGDVFGAGPITEDVLLRPKSLYGASKAAAEFLVTGYGRQVGFETLCLRISTVYGPARKHFCAIRTLVDAAVTGQVGHLDHGREDLRQYVHVSDVAEAIFLAVASPRSPPAALNITGGSHIRMSAIARMVAQQVDGFFWDIGATPDPGEDIHLPFSIEAAHQSIGYEPHVKLEDGIAELVHHARNLKPDQRR